MIRLLFEPIDVVMFRDSRSFTAGEDVVAKSIIPFPQTFAGAIRSLIYLKHNHDNSIVSDFIGYKREEPQFTVYGTFMSYMHNEVFPIPQNLREYIDKTGKLHIDVTIPKVIKWIDHDEKLVLVGKSFHHKSVPPGFFTRRALELFLEGRLDTDMLEESIDRYIIQRESLLVEEDRIGIALSYLQKTAKEGFLYRTEFLRLRDNAGFIIWVEDTVNKYLDDTGITKVGGENRLVTYTKLRDAIEFDLNLNELINTINSKGRMLIYIATPTIIKKDRTYTFNIASELEKVLNISVTRIFWATNKLIPISGWDLAKNYPKKVIFAIPPGSVFFVEFTGTVNLNEFFVKIGMFKKIGYGLTFVGIWR